MSVKAKKRVMSLEPYNVGKRFELPVGWECFDWNESAFPPTPHVRNAIEEFMKSGKMEKYPDISNKRLKEELSLYVNLPTSHIEAYNGSDAALRDIFAVFVDEETRVLSYQPSYTQVDTFIVLNTEHYTQVQIEDPLGNHVYDFSHCANYDVVYLVTPNNPTGKTISLSVITSLVEKYRETLFVVDEAYYEYSGISCSDLVLEHENLLVIRTFSKAFGLAALRLGYVLGHPSSLFLLRKIKNGKSVNALSQVAGIACLEDLSYLHARVSEIKESKRAFIEGVNRFPGFYALESEANFVLLRVPDVSSFIDTMTQNKIVVRDRSYITNLENCVRITIGSLVHVDNILNIIERST